MSEDLRQLAFAMALDDVALVPFLVEHVGPEYLRWINDPEVMRYTEARWLVHNHESAVDYVRRSNGSPQSKLFRILSGEEHVGNLRLSAIDQVHSRAEVALIIGEAAARGRGVGRKAIQIAAAHGFVTLSLNKLTAGIYASNEPSIRAFESAGFSRIAELRRHYRCEGSWVDGLIVERMSPFGGIV